MKRCTKCDRRKVLEAFAKDSSRKDGRQVHCRECGQEYYRRHRKVIRARVKSWYRKNRSRANTRSAAWYWRNLATVRAQSKRYRETHRADIYAYQKAWRRKNRKHVVAQKKAWAVSPAGKASQKRRYLKNREVILARVKEYAHRNRENIRAYQQRYYAERAPKLRAYWHQSEKPLLIAIDESLCTLFALIPPRMRPQLAQELIDLPLGDVTVTVKLRTCRVEDHIADALEAVGLA